MRCCWPIRHPRVATIGKQQRNNKANKDVFLEPAYTEKDILSCDALHHSLLYIGAQARTHQGAFDERAQSWRGRYTTPIYFRLTCRLPLIAGFLVGTHTLFICQLTSNSKGAEMEVASSPFKFKSNLRCFSRKSCNRSFPLVAVVCDTNKAV